MPWGPMLLRINFFSFFIHEMQVMIRQSCLPGGSLLTESKIKLRLRLTGTQSSYQESSRFDNKALLLGFVSESVVLPCK